MGAIKMRVETCSSDVRAGIGWLEKNLKTKEKRELRTRLEKVKKEEGLKSYSARILLDRIKRISRSKYLCDQVEEAYVLSLVGSPFAKEYKSAASKKEFWLKEGNLDDALWDNRHLLWYLAKLGLMNNKYFKEAFSDLLRSQMVTGEIQSNELSHVGPLRVLVQIEPYSHAAEMAISYFLDNWKTAHFDIGELAIGILALTELDYLKYENEIKKIASYLEKRQNKNGYWGRIYYHRKGEFFLPFEETSYVVQALSRLDNYKKSIQKAVGWLEKRKNADGSWGKRGWCTAAVLLALIAAGEGPKIPYSLVEFELMKVNQNLRRSKTSFKCTSPIKGVKEIEITIREMIRSAKKRVWISSRFITEFWTNLINMKKEKPDLDIRVMTVPKSEMKSMYGEGRKFAEPAFDSLQRCLGGNLRTNKILHARLIIVDNEVLVSSADLTKEQLENEFNAGIWTRDKEITQNAVDFFESIWEISKIS